MNLKGFYNSTLGKKYIVAITGAFLVFFILGHMAGNLKAFAGISGDGIHKLDHYAEFLREFASPILGQAGFLWLFRIALFAALVLHITTVIQLQIINKKARINSYKREQNSWAKRFTSLMFIGGLVILFFVIFHILHLTLGTIHPQFVHGEVFANISIAFANPLITLIYIVAIAFLGLHLNHGLWSVFQTLGLNQKECSAKLKTLAQILSVVVVLGFISVPLAIFLGLI